MDPVATIRRIIDAVSERDYDEAQSALDDLITWRRSGGFVNVRAENGER